MTYGFRPDNWPTFEAELQKRGIAAGDIERIEIRPRLSNAGDVVEISLTLRSGRVESWSQPREA